MEYTGNIYISQYVTVKIIKQKLKLFIKAKSRPIVWVGLKIRQKCPQELMHVYRNSEFCHAVAVS